LAALPVVRGNTEFDCQTWVVAGVRKLQDEGYVKRTVTANEIREELEKEKERWQIADDTLIERLIPTLPMQTLAQNVDC